MAVFKDTTSNEWHFDTNDYILSETDEKGFILYANQVFLDIANYT
jgi:hypothetical protein